MVHFHKLSLHIIGMFRHEDQTQDFHSTHDELQIGRQRQVVDGLMGTVLLLLTTFFTALTKRVE